MKKLLFSILCLFSLTISSQNEVLPDEFPTYQGIVKAEGKTADVIYSNIKAWAATAYNSANNVIQLDDKGNGKMIIKATSPFSYKAAGVTIDSRCYYTLTIDVKDNRFRYTINVTEVEVGTNNQSAYKQLLEKPDNKQSKEIMKRIEVIKESIISGLTGSVLTKDDDNW